MRILFLALIAFCIYSCGSDGNLSDYMVGKWQTQKLDITMNTPFGQDTTIQYIIDFNDENDPRAQVKARSEYYDDGTFDSWYVGFDGTESPKTRGSWSVEADNLTVDYTNNGIRINATYLVERTDYGFQGESTYDWDNDGEQDDFLIQETVKVEKFE